MANKKKKLKGAPAYIIERRQFVDDRGRVIVGQTMLYGEPPEDFAPFLGTGNIELAIKTKMGVMKAQNNVTFGLEAESIEEAFVIVDARFEEVKEEETEKMRVEALEKIEAHQRPLEKTKGGILLPPGMESGNGDPRFPPGGKRGGG